MSETRKLLNRQKRNITAKLKREEKKEYSNFDRCWELQEKLNSVLSDLDRLEACGL